MRFVDGTGYNGDGKFRVYINEKGKAGTEEEIRLSDAQKKELLSMLAPETAEPAKDKQLEALTKMLNQPNR